MVKDSSWEARGALCLRVYFLDRRWHPILCGLDQPIILSVPQSSCTVNTRVSLCLLLVSGKGLSGSPPLSPPEISQRLEANQETRKCSCFIIHRAEQHFLACHSGHRHNHSTLKKKTNRFYDPDGFSFSPIPYLTMRCMGVLKVWG